MITKTVSSPISGIAIPRMIYGTAWKKERTQALVFQAIQLGFRGIDTACQPRHYHEPGVGEALLQLQKVGITRDQLYLQTKFTSLEGQDPQRIPYDKNADLKEQVAQSFLSTQKNLGTDYVDSLVLHAPFDTLRETMEAWSAMEKICKSGGAKQLGISNCYDLELLQSIFTQAEVKPAIVQNRFYADSNYDRELRIFCSEKGIFYQSFWSLTANPHILQHKVLQGAVKEFKKTEAQIFFRFLLQISILPLTGTCSEKHMREDLEVFDFSLPESLIKEISALLRM